jgi:hypothetical protein
MASYMRLQGRSPCTHSEHCPLIGGTEMRTSAVLDGNMSMSKAGEVTR